jgi:RNA polymerase sigma factor (sigma-70 family)
VTEASFLALVNENKGIIFKLVSLYAVDNEEKKDLYQEILLQAWKSVKSFRHDAKFSSWLYRLCINTILTQRRKSIPIDYTDSIETIQVTDCSHHDNSIDFELLKTSIRRLPEVERAIISMHLDGYDNAEIAECMGISRNNVAVKIHRIKQQLTNFIKSER